MRLSKFESLWAVVKSIESDQVTRSELLEFVNSGTETDLSDIFALDDGQLITLMNDGKIKRTIVYISEKPRWHFDRGFKLPTYHFFKCQKLEEMISKGKINRYKKTSRQDGKFLIIISSLDDRESIFPELLPCSYCINTYNQKFNENHDKKDFPLQNIFNSNNQILENINFDFMSRPQNYPKDWSRISSLLKKKNNFVCNHCNRAFEGNNTKFLQVHHRDSRPSNNELANLEVLCVGCHASQHLHSHMKVLPIYKEFQDWANYEG